MALGKQAKTLTQKQIEIALSYLATTRYGLRNQVVFLLSTKAGLRAKEIAGLQWSMVVDATGQVGNSINITNAVSKGSNGGRSIPINRDLKQHLVQLFDQVSQHARFDVHAAHVVTTERAGFASAQSVVNQFAKWYSDLGFIGCSSHSGRRTFITNAARKISTVGGVIPPFCTGAGSRNVTQPWPTAV
jgi:integrase